MTTNIWFPIGGMKRYIASSAAFQTATGAANATAALAFVKQATNDDVQIAMPAFAVVRTVNGMTRSEYGVGNWKTVGTLVVTMGRYYDTVAMTEEDSIADLENQFSEWTSSVWLEIEAQVNARSLVMGENPLAYRSVRSAGAPKITPVSEGYLQDTTDPDASSVVAGKILIWEEFDVELY